MLLLTHAEDGTTWATCPTHATLTLATAKHHEPLVPVCRWCGEAMTVPARPQGGGRTKRFCSPACRAAAHRANRWPADTLHGALGVEKATR